MKKLKKKQLKVKVDGVLNNGIITLFIMNFLKQGKKFLAEKLIYKLLCLLNILLKQNSKFLLYKALQNILLPIKFINKSFQNKIKKVALFLGFLSNLKTALRVLINKPRTLIKVKCYLFKFLLEAIKSITQKSEAFKTQNVINQSFFLNKKYLNYYWY